MARQRAPKRDAVGNTRTAEKSSHARPHSGPRSRSHASSTEQPHKRTGQAPRTHARTCTQMSRRAELTAKGGPSIPDSAGLFVFMRCPTQQGLMQWLWTSGHLIAMSLGRRGVSPRSVFSEARTSQTLRKRGRLHLLSDEWEGVGGTLPAASHR